MEKRLGFIQIPVLVLIVVGVIAAGGVAVFGVHEYQKQEIEKLKLQNQITTTEQTKEAEEANEVEKLKAEIEKLKTQTGIEKKPTPKPTPPPAQTSTSKKQLTNAQIIAKIKPAVVYIESKDGSGTGMLLEKNGIILTNAHVVEGINTASIKTSKGNSYTVSVLGRDENKDLAVLKVENSTDLFSIAELGDSATVSQGDEVFALGYPFGIQGDVSFKEGTISRLLSEGEASYLETSAEIHPGNSGGPLVDRFGKVIGINTAIFGKGIKGIILGETIKLAIPINTAKESLTALKNGQVVLATKSSKSSSNASASMCQATKADFVTFDQNYKNILTSLTDILTTFLQASDAKLNGQIDFDYGYHKMFAQQLSFHSKVIQTTSKVNQLDSESVNSTKLLTLKTNFLNGLSGLTSSFDTFLASYELLTNDQKIYLFGDWFFPPSNIDQSKALYEQAFATQNDAIQKLQSGESKYAEIKTDYNSALLQNSCEKVLCQTAYTFSQGECVRAPLKVTKLSPLFGTNETIFTILGENFGDTQESQYRVYVGYNQAQIVSWSNAEIKFKPNTTSKGPHNVGFTGGSSDIGLITITN